MKDFGAFLSNLRGSAGLSLEELAKLVDSSKSTLSRLENNDVPQPFKGSMRKLIITLGEILCTSKREAERYLALASIHQSLLTETEDIQLGFTPHIATDSPKEATNLERFKNIYQQLIQPLNPYDAKLGTSNSPPNLKLKIQEYSNILKQIRNQRHS